MRDLKYLAALSIPLSAAIGLNLKGLYLFSTPIFAFIIIPLLEVLMPMDETNLSEDQVESKLKNSLFDWLLYLNIPIVYGVLVYSLMIVTNTNLDFIESLGLVLTTGIVLGVNGINVGHELGHRIKTPERFLGKLLLLPSLYMHFFIEHNFGHHLHVATKEDPATAKYNQSLYAFWFTSVTQQYFSAWKIQINLLKTKNNRFLSLKNDMLWYAVIQITYLIVVFLAFGVKGLIFAILFALVGFLLLETVNYIEHYGLLRKKNESGRYERVQKIHSWNSNHIIGRIVLYELTRHSDHHYKSNKKYQILDCHEESPQMPYGYPTSMVLALIPPLWFSIMNKRIPKNMIY